MNDQVRKITLPQHASILLLVLVGAGVAFKDYRAR